VTTGRPAVDPRSRRVSPTLRPVATDPSTAPPLLVRSAISTIEQVGDRYWVLRLVAPAVAATALPGQFVMVSLAAPEEPVITLPRPIAVYGVDAATGTIDLCIGVVGAGTERLASLEPGTLTTIVGPLGRSFPLSPAAPDVLLVGRGIGVCSLTELARAAAAGGASVTAVVSGRHGGALVGVDRLARHGATVVGVTDTDGSSDPTALAATLRGRFDGRPPAMVATCGSERLLDMCVGLAGAWGAALYTSVEEHMACGLGYCHGCALPGRGAEREGPLVCTHGPVFEVAVPSS
jgi:dihydroorotate dehydrogenase electron transfer subunit